MLARARIAVAALTAGLMLSLPSTAARQLTTFQSGDVFLSIGGGSVLIYRFLPETQTYEAVNALGAEDAAEFPTVGSAFDADGNFYVTTFTTGATSGKIYRFARDFDANTQTPVPIETFGNAPESVIIDAAGDLYVGHGRQPGDVITKIRVAPDGTATLLATYAAEVEGLFTAGDAPPRTPQGTDWIDLANDQRTLFYTSQGRRIFRFDTATAAQLPDFANLAATDDPRCTLQPPPVPCGQLFALRLLPDGGLLVADNLDVKRLDALGTVVQIYDLPFESPRFSHDNWFSLNLDPDGQSFWSGDGHDGQIHRFDIATGTRTATIDVGAVNAFFGVSIFKELTQATTPPTRCESTVLTVPPVAGTTCGTLTLTAQFACGGEPVAGRTIDFSVNGQPHGQAVTDADGIATLAGVSSPDSSGSTPSAITAAFAGDDDYASASGAGDLSLTNGTTLTVSPTAGDTCGALTLTGALACGTKPVANKPISFLLNGISVGTATTNATGVATLSNVQPPDTAGSFPLSASFAGDGSIETATGTATVTLSDGTVLTVPNVSGDTCGALTLSSTLVCGTKSVANKPVSFVLNGLAVGSATTNASGVATLSNVEPPDAPGTVPLTASFAGDATLAAATGGGSATLSNGTTLVVESVSGSTCGTLTLVGTLACGAKSVANLSISYALGAQTVGQATTNASGVATLTNVPSPPVPGSFPGAVAASFAGSPRIAPASDTADLTLVDGCTPALSLVKTASPTTYSALGEGITYTYTLTNSGQVPLTSPFTVIDDKLGSFACSAAASLAPQASLACEKAYAIKSSDLGTAATPLNAVGANVNTGPWLQGVLSTQDTTISGAAGLVDGIYPGWCIQDHVIIDLHNEPGTLYSTVGVTLPAELATLPWNQINYVLNHKIRAPGKNDLEFFKDVQTAIWVLLGEKNPDFGISATARQMVADARANPTFVPGPDDVVAVVISSDGMGTNPMSIQESIIEVRPFRSITNHAVATARAGTVTVQSNQAEATVRQVLPGTPTGLMDAVAWGHQPAARTTVNTSPFSTTTADELLLAFISADYLGGANTRVTAVTGAGLTWQLVTRANGQKGTSEIWRAFSQARLANETVAASLSQAVSSAITVITFKNVDTSGVNGAGAIGAIVSRSGASGAPTATLTATRTGSSVFAAGNDWDRPIARVPVSGQAIVHQYLPPVGDTFWVQRTSAGSVAGSPVTIQDVSPTGDSWNLAAVEILPAGGAPLGAAVVPAGASSPKPEADQTVSIDGPGTVTTRAFSTSESVLLLAFAAADGPSNARQSLTISGAGLSWTLVQRANLQAGTSEIWRAYAPGPLSQVNVSSTPRRGGFHQSLTVVTFTNATGVGASASAGGPSGAPSAAITSTGAGSLVYGVGNDWDRASARTLGPGQQMVHQWVDRSVGDTFWVQAAGSPTAAAGTSIRLNATAPSNDRWNLAIVEIVR